MFANLALHLRRLSSRRLIRLERIDPARIDKTLRFFVRNLPALVDAERCNVFIYDPSAAKAWVELGTGIAEGEFEVPVKSTHIGEVIASGRSLIANDLASRAEAQTEFGGPAGTVTRNAACVPIRSRYHDEVIGVVEVVNKRADCGFAPTDLRVLEQAAEIVQDLVDSVFLGQKVYGATEDVIDAGRQTAVGVLGLVLLGAMLTLLFMAAWSAMPIINDALNPSLAPFLPDAKP